MVNLVDGMREVSVIGQTRYRGERFRANLHEAATVKTVAQGGNVLAPSTLVTCPRAGCIPTRSYESLTSSGIVSSVVPHTNAGPRGVTSTARPLEHHEGATSDAQS